jgi:hypothetical protein
MPNGQNGLLVAGKFSQLPSLLRPRRAVRTRTHLCSAQGPGSVDYGTEDEDSLAKEFESLKNRLAPESNVKKAAHLNLLWSVSEVSAVGAHSPSGLLSLTPPSRPPAAQTPRALRVL